MTSKYIKLAAIIVNSFTLGRIYDKLNTDPIMVGVAFILVVIILGFSYKLLILRGIK